MLIGGCWRAGPSGQEEAQLQLLEGQLSWLVHIIGAVIRGRNNSSAGENQARSFPPAAAHVLPSLSCWHAWLL